MARFILRASGAAAPEETTAALASSPGVQVVDRSPKMLLLEASEEDARELAAQLPGWSLHPEVQYQAPDARKTIE